MSSCGSMAFQIQQAFRQITHQGMSKTEMREQGLAPGEVIRSAGTARAYVKASVNFARWAKQEYGVREIRELTPEMAARWLDQPNQRSGETRSAWTTKQYAGALKAFSHAIEAKFGQRTELVARGWVGPRRHNAERSGVHSGGYSPAAMQRIGEYLMHRNPQAGIAFRTMAETGFRTATVIGSEGQQGLKGLRASGVNLSEQRIEGVHKTGKPTSIGRWDADFKSVPRGQSVDVKHFVSGALMRDYARLMQGRSGNDRLFSISYSSLIQEVRGACQALGERYYGLHGVRVGYAVERYRTYRGAGLSNRQARQRLSDDLGHGRISVTYSYVKSSGR